MDISWGYPADVSKLDEDSPFLKELNCSSTKVLQEGISVYLRIHMREK